MWEIDSLVKKNVKKVSVKTKPEAKMTQAPAIWSPFDILEDVSQRFMNDSWVSPWWGNWLWRQPKASLLSDMEMKYVPVDLIDTGKEYKVLAEMPGVDKKNLEVTVTDNNISICGETETEVKKEQEGYIHRERSYSTLCRNLRFPEAVNPDKAEATLTDGVLEVKIPKRKPTSGGKVVPIK